MQCYGIEGELVIPVAVARRSEAIALLEFSPIAPLDTVQAARFTGSEGQSLTAQKLVKDSIVRLTAEKERVLSTRTGSWAGQEARLVQLERLETSSSLAMLQPFLVRGVAKNERTGGFGASWCGNDLVVAHLSLGAEPPTMRIPIVVFLEKVPAGVYVTWAMAR